jgi:hypothetical protein
MFWPIFKEAWKESFSVKNIQKAFETTRIWPLDPFKTINKIQKPALTSLIHSKLSPLSITTPQTTRAIRHLCKASLSLKKLAILKRAVLWLATKFEI